MTTRMSDRSDPPFSHSADGPGSADLAPTHALLKLPYDSEGCYLEREDL